METDTLSESVGAFGRSKKTNAWRSFGRSLGSSAAATALDGLVAWSLALLLVVPGPIATFLGAAAGGVTNWLLNRTWAFESRGPMRSEAFRYALVSTGAAVLNTAGVAALEGPLGFSAAWLVTRAGVFAGFTFVLFRTFVFKTRGAR